MTGGFIYMQVTSCYSQSCYLNLRRLNQHSTVCIRLTSPHLICQTEIQKPQLYFFALTIKKDRCIYVITKNKTFILVNGVVISGVYIRLLKCMVIQLISLDQVPVGFQNT